MTLNFILGCGCWIKGGGFVLFGLVLALAALWFLCAILVGLAHMAKGVGCFVCAWGSFFHFPPLIFSQISTCADIISHRIPFF